LGDFLPCEKKRFYSAKANPFIQPKHSNMASFSHGTLQHQHQHQNQTSWVSQLKIPFQAQFPSLLYEQDQDHPEFVRFKEARAVHLRKVTLNSHDVDTKT
jgi:hypothetical protein